MRSARPFVLVAAAALTLSACAMRAERENPEPAAEATDRVADALKKSGPTVTESKRDWWSSKSSSCTSCLQARCTNYLGQHPVLQNCSDAACREPVNCAMQRRCFTNIMELPHCYCGPVTVEECQKPEHVPNGSCREAMERGLDTTVRSEVMGRWVDAKYPAGRANQFLTCLSELCVAECVSES
jgi:hypothetical protein